MKTVRVIFSPEAEEVYRHLNAQATASKVDRMILNAINKKIELIKSNFHYGNPIAKKFDTARISCEIWSDKFIQGGTS